MARAPGRAHGLYVVVVGEGRGFPFAFRGGEGGRSPPSERGVTVSSTEPDVYVSPSDSVSRFPRRFYVNPTLYSRVSFLKHAKMSACHAWQARMKAQLRKQAAELDMAHVLAHSRSRRHQWLLLQHAPATQAEDAYTRAP